MRSRANSTVTPFTDKTMHLPSALSPQRISLVVLVAAAIVLCVFAGRQWNFNRTQTYESGNPPKEILNDIEAKHVPYETIKPWAVSTGDIFLAGSPSSTVGIIFFGDYFNPASNKLVMDLIPIIAGYHGNVRLVWHFLPASVDDKTPSFEAAVLSYCSYLLDKKWPAHWYLLQLDAKSKAADVDNIAQMVGDKEGKLESCRRDESVRSLLRLEAKTARGDGIDNAPFIFAGTNVFPATQSSAKAIDTAIQSYLK